MRDSLVFYRSFAEAADDLPPEQYKEFIQGVLFYALDDQEPDFSGICGTLFKLIKPQIDANNKKFADGKKGGRPKKERKEKPVVSELKTSGYETEKPVVSELKTSGFENENQWLSDSKPNVNDNVNVNVNDNVNENNHRSHDNARAREVKSDVEPIILNDYSGYVPCQADLNGYVKKFKSIDVRQEFHEMHEYSIGNRTIRTGNVKEFIWNWLTRKEAIANEQTIQAAGNGDG